MRHRKKEYKKDFDQEKVNFLITGEMTKDPEFSWDAFTFKSDRKEQATFWKANRENILKDFIADHSGHRPYFWWEIDATEKRKQIRGRKIKAMWPGDIVYHFGVADYSASYALGESKNKIIPDNFETQTEYLKRLNLLTEAEKKLLKLQDKPLETFAN